MYSTKDIICFYFYIVMKTTYTIAAIAMFAVILGMGVLAPAMASKPVAGENHRIEFCHYQEAKPQITDAEGNITQVEVLEAYVVIETDKKGQMNGHFKHGDAHHFPVNADGSPTGDEGDFLFSVDEITGEPVDLEGNDTIAECETLNANLQD